MNFGGNSNHITFDKTFFMEVIDMKSVESSHIESIGYDKDCDELYVKFTGGLYRYENVSKTEYNELMNAKSKGTYINNFIKGRKNCLSVKLV